MSKSDLSHKTIYVIRINIYMFYVYIYIYTHKGEANLFFKYVYVCVCVCVCVCVYTWEGSFSRSITNIFLPWYLCTYISFWVFTFKILILDRPFHVNRLPHWLVALSPSAAWKQSSEKLRNCWLSVLGRGQQIKPRLLQHTWHS